MKLKAYQLEVLAWEVVVSTEVSLCTTPDDIKELQEALLELKNSHLLAALTKVIPEIKKALKTS